MKAPLWHSGYRVPQAEAPAATGGSGGAQRSGTVYTVQALRAVAALLVVAQHTISMCVDLGRARAPFRLNGSTGLDIFFVLSGFIMPLSVRRSGRPWHDGKRFLLRRMERIVPLYWIATTVKLIKDLVFPGTVALSLGHTLASYVFLPSRNSLGEVVPLLPPGWTLNMEAIFYLLIAAALLLRMPLKLFLPPALLLLAAGVFVHFAQALPIDGARLPLFVEFLFGMALAARYRAVNAGRARCVPAALAVVCFVVSGLLIALSRWSVLAPLLFAGPLAFLLVGSAIELEPRVARHIPRFLLLLGDASYSIYLVHWFFVGLVHYLMGLRPLAAVDNFAVPFGLVMGMSIAAGLLCYRWIESPLNHYFHVRRRTATGT